MHQVPEQKVDLEIEKQKRLDLLKDLEEEFKGNFGDTDFNHRRVFFKVPKKILAEFAKQVLTYENLSTVHSDENLVFAPMNISESFLSLQEDKVLIVFEATDTPDPEAESYVYSVQCIKAHEDVLELSKSLEKLGPETKILGGYLEKNTGYIVFLTRSKGGAGKKVYHQHAGNA
jgi:hypothetical protein